MGAKMINYANIRFRKNPNCDLEFLYDYKPPDSIRTNYNIRSIYGYNLTYPTDNEWYLCIIHGSDIYASPYRDKCFMFLRLYFHVLDGLVYAKLPNDAVEALINIKFKFEIESKIDNTMKFYINREL